MYLLIYSGLLRSTQVYPEMYYTSSGKHCLVGCMIETINVKPYGDGMLRTTGLSVSWVDLGRPGQTWADILLTDT